MVALCTEAHSTPYTWPPFHYAKLASSPTGKRRLYRCYPDGHVELLNIEVGELSTEDGWSVVGPTSDGPLSIA
jgi:hypothetical protein